MRKVSAKEAKKRGCEYCLYSYKIGECKKFLDTLSEQEKAHQKKVEQGYEVDRLRKGLCCGKPKCPYRELDKYDDYRDYLKATGGGIVEKLRGMMN